MPVKSYTVGPGTLKLGETGTEQDFSAQVTACRVTWANEIGDATPVLSGEELAGDVEWSASLVVTFVQDIAAAGIAEYTWTNRGDQVPFTFTPSTAAARSVTGVVTITPIDVGGDAKAKPTSEVTWACVGDPALGALA